MVHIEHPITSIIIAFILFNIYWMGRIDGFSKSRSRDNIDRKISESIRHFQNFVFRNSSRFYEIIKNFIRK
ncbi:hypothetical protein BU591_01020 [Staphylococcus agnetis]|nr:hypothetical protein BU591_01020 [Staphylococcus agnetis]PTH30165.1 hypothetical protein BU590_01080 [Staphylococcus agnetis]PTH31878.1 hypothetical protein BU589_08510 [Staphylococcus agnetis]PTH35764.1 hypothetical protein BU585_07790 [Staphylococcus agnetis]